MTWPPAAPPLPTHKEVSSAPYLLAAILIWILLGTAIAAVGWHVVTMAFHPTFKDTVRLGAPVFLSSMLPGIVGPLLIWTKRFSTRPGNLIWGVAWGLLTPMLLGVLAGGVFFGLSRLMGTGRLSHSTEEALRYLNFYLVFGAAFFYQLFWAPLLSGFLGGLVGGQLHWRASLRAG